MNLYVLSYNNYYNRIVKKEETLAGYNSFVIYGPVEGVYGFTPGDGVNTTQLLGSNPKMYNGEGDYLLAVNENGEIDSRWFIIDTKRERTGQWTLTLHRDLVVDFYEQLLESPMFIEKATLPSDNDLIFNSEQMTFNQIKQTETPLYDKTNTPWIIGYLSAKLDTNVWKQYQTLDTTYAYPLSNYKDLLSYTTNPKKVMKKATFQYYWIESADGNSLYKILFDKNVGGVLKISRNPGWKTGTQLIDNDDLIYTNVIPYIRTATFQNDVILNNLSELAGVYTKPEDDLSQYRNKIVINNETGRYYQIKVIESEEKLTENYRTLDIATNTPLNNIKTTMIDLLQSSDDIQTTEISDDLATPNIEVEVSYVEQKLLLLEVDLGGRSVTLNAQARILEDAPYYMFAIPYSVANLRLATLMATQLGENCHDMQILPYFPEQTWINELNGTIDLDSLTENVDYIPIKEQDEVVDYLYWSSKSNFDLDITFSLPVSLNPAEKKIQIECDMYRLCSPNGNGEFQFNVAKNNGVTKFNVDCTYRPINPYIHMNPDFGGLYGYDANDFRGLILQGDFSIPLVNDQWVQYEIQNKNYQNSFNRQIENMEVQHKAARIQDIVGGITGAASGAAAGAAAGSIIPGVGTAVGAAVGGVTSAVGGVADYFINEMLRNEAIDYTKDQFGYQLGNIQARPQSIAKTGCLTFNNKLVPYLEYYSCKDIEKEALINKIAYNGMSVGVIGLFGDYINNDWSYTTPKNKTIQSKGYIKGQLIRLEGTDDDYHIVNSLAGELNKGVYTKWE